MGITFVYARNYKKQSSQLNEGSKGRNECGFMSIRLGGVMDSASDFGSDGCGFKSHPGRTF